METVIWVLTGIWLAMFGVLWWRAFRRNTAKRMVGLVVGGLVGLVPYLWLLYEGRLSEGYRSAMNVTFTLIAIAALIAAAWRAQSRGTTR